MNKSKYNKRNKPQSLPQYGWGSTIGGIAGGALGTLLGPFGTTIGAGLGSQLGNMIDGEENTQGNIPQMPQLNIDPVNTQDFYNPVKAYGGSINGKKNKNNKTKLEFLYDKNNKSLPDSEYNFKNKNNNPQGNIDKELNIIYNLVKLGDPTGITSYGDVYNAWNDNKFDYNDILQPFSALPMVGGIGRAIKTIPKVGKSINYTQKGASLYDFIDSTKNYNKDVYMYPFGGQTQPNAEVEGNEVIQYQPGMQPQAIGQGNMQQIASDMSVAKGPTHANGGVPVAAQPGSMVISDRLPAPNTKEYKSIANKVEQLGRKKGQLEKKIEKNPNDKIAKDTIELVQKQIDTLIQQQEQMKAMNAESIMAKAYQKAYGGNINLDPMFLKLWNTGSYAYGGKLPKYDGINNPSSFVGDFMPDYTKLYDPMKGQYPLNHSNLNPDMFGQENILPINNLKGNIPIQKRGITNKGIVGKINNESNPMVLPTINKIETPNTQRVIMQNKKQPFTESNLGQGLQYAAQYIPDVMAMFTKKDKPIDPNMYMNTSRVTPAKYDTSAEEAAVIDARNQAMMLAKETSGGDAGMYANLGNVANTGAYKNLGQVYNKAQNINMQNKMAADQANAGIEGQNRQMALNVANMNQADAQAVESMRQAGMQGLSNKLANQYSQNKQFKLLESMFPHYKYNNDGSVTYNGKTYYGDEATGIVDNLKMYASKLGVNWFGGK